MIGYETKMVLDSGDIPHLLVSDTDGKLNYYKNQTGSWDDDKLYVTGAFLDMDLDDLGRSHLAYFNYVKGTLHYGIYTSGDLKGMRLGNSSGLGTESSLSQAIDSLGNLHAVFQAGDGSLLHATNASGHWETESIDSASSGYSMDAFLTVDSNDVLHLLYDNGYLYYVSNQTGNWVIEQIDSTSRAYQVALQTDGSNRIHGCFVVASNGNVGFYSSIFVDPNGFSHITYNNLDSLGLYYATNLSGNWVLSPLDTAGFVEGYSVLEMGPDGLFHVIYQGLASVMHGIFPPGWAGK